MAISVNSKSPSLPVCAVRAFGGGLEGGGYVRSRYECAGSILHGSLNFAGGLRHNCGAGGEDEDCEQRHPESYSRSIDTPLYGLRLRPSHPGPG